MAFLQQQQQQSNREQNKQQQQWCCSSKKYSCESAAKTLEWINAIVDFIRPYSSLTNAHVVNFFKDRLWESIDSQWIACLSREPVRNLLLIPSGVVQDHWPVSLKEFIETLRSLVFPREQANLFEVFPGLNVKSLSSVLVQGMNPKKKHEVEVLSAIVSSVANSVEAQTIVDVGAGQGYLAQVLSFEYQHSVIAIDACAHHGRVTEARAERIKGHYSAQIRKYNSGCGIPNAPKTVTCCIMSAKILKALTKMTFSVDDINQSEMIEEVQDNQTSVVLAGLHACGDLSVTMLRTFLQCKEVKAVISIGCCYNLLSETCCDAAASACGFPMSNGIKSAGISIGKNSRDLACQSAERWMSLGKDAGLHNFELHAYRAAFQLLLSRYYPEIMVTSPSIGRQGKALRRKHQRTNWEVSLHHEESKCSSLPQKVFELNMSPSALRPDAPNEASGSVLGTDDMSYGMSCNGCAGCEGTASVDKCSLFKKFCESGFSRLALKPLVEIHVQETWKEAEPFAELIGPYWSLRAALGPLLETLLLLDRLLFLQEQEDQLETVMLPIFDPVLSPRNVAIIAKRS